MLMATLLARMPDLRRRAQTLHVAADDWSCRECGSEVQWPCDVYQIATDAERLAGMDLAEGLGGWMPEPRRVPTRRSTHTLR